MTCDGFAAPVIVTLTFATPLEKPPVGVGEIDPDDTVSETVHPAPVNLVSTVVPEFLYAVMTIENAVPEF